MLKAIEIRAKRFQFVINDETSLMTAPDDYQSDQIGHPLRFYQHGFGLHCALMKAAFYTIVFPINEKFKRSMYVKNC